MKKYKYKAYDIEEARKIIDNYPEKHTQRPVMQEQYDRIVNDRDKKKALKTN